MNTAGDSAEQIVRLSLEGMEVAFKIVGEGAKNIAVMIYAIMKESKQTKGKTRLTNMLKTEKELKIYSFKAENLKKFSQEAKRYGVLYCVLADRKNEKIDGIVDVMIREQDASKVNRIAERFKFEDVDKATIARDLEEQEKKGQEPQDKEIQQKSKTEAFAKDVLSKPKQKEEQLVQESSPSFENTEEKNQLEISLNTNTIGKKKIVDTIKKSSVKKELQEIEQKVKEREAIKDFKKPKHLDSTKRKKKELRKEGRQK